MKKLALTAAVVTLIMGFAEAQLDNLRLGLQLSPTISWISVNDDQINKTGSSVGISVGGIAEYYFTENLAFTGGFGVSFGQGGTLQHEHGGNYWPNSELSDDRLNTGDKPLPDNVKLRYRLQYIQIPLAIKLRTNERGYLRYFAELPVITLGMNTHARGDIEGQEIDFSKENISKDVNFFNMQLGLGGGVEYSISPSTSLVGGLYLNFGLNDITKDDGVRAADNPDQAPSNPNDDYLFSREDSRGRLSNVTLRIAIMF